MEVCEKQLEESKQISYRFGGILNFDGFLESKTSIPYEFQGIYGVDVSEEFQEQIKAVIFSYTNPEQFGDFVGVRISEEC